MEVGRDNEESKVKGIERNIGHRHCPKQDRNAKRRETQQQQFVSVVSMDQRKLIDWMATADSMKLASNLCFRSAARATTDAIVALRLRSSSNLFPNITHLSILSLRLKFKWNNKWL